MTTVVTQRHLRGIDRLAGGDGVAFDAGDLHQARDGVTGQAERVLHGDLRRIADLGRCPTEGLGEPCSGHGCRGADLTLAVDLRPEIDARSL